MDDPPVPRNGLCTTNRREGPDTQSALANRQFGTSFCTILSNQLCRKVIDKADCRRMFQIGDRRMLIAYFRTEFVRRDLLCKTLLCQGGEFHELPVHLMTTRPSTVGDSTRPALMKSTTT